MIIGIDHGFNYMKTAETSFLTGVKESMYEPPINKNVVEFGGRYFSVGGSRMTFRPDKTADINYFILTLAAISMELDARKEKIKKEPVNVALCVGLPYKRLGVEKDSFIKYLKSNPETKGAKEIVWKFEGRPYKIRIADVQAYPQGYAALFARLQELPRVCIMADLGGGTFEVALIQGGIPDLDKSYSLNGGVISGIEKVKEELRTQFGQEVEEEQIRELIMDPAVPMAKKYKEVIIRVLQEYANSIVGKLIELGFNLDTLQVFWCGGGASLIKNYASYDPDMSIFVTDTRANAKGYELMYKIKNGNKNA